MGPQVPAYQHAAGHNGAEWLCFLDADEFLVLEDYDSVSDLVRVAGQHGMPISLNWKIFGSNGERYYRNELVVNRFPRCGEVTEDVNRHIKTIGPKSAVDAGARVHVHGWVLAEGQYYVDALGDRIEVEGCTFVTPPRWKAAWVNHYIVKSLEEFEAKCRRGRATNAVDDPEKYRLNMDNYFNIYDCNQGECQFIQRVMPELRLSLIETKNSLGLT